MKNPSINSPFRPHKTKERKKMITSEKDQTPLKYLESTDAHDFSFILVSPSCAQNKTPFRLQQRNGPGFDSCEIHHRHEMTPRAKTMNTLDEDIRKLRLPTLNDDDYRENPLQSQGSEILPTSTPSRDSFAGRVLTPRDSFESPRPMFLQKRRYRRKQETVTCRSSSQEFFPPELYIPQL